MYRTLLKGEQKSLAEKIHQVEVWCDSDFLRTREMEIVDTPGLGSVFPAHKAVTHEVIPSVDATLFLVQADPGVGDNDIVVPKVHPELCKSDILRADQERHTPARPTNWKTFSDT